MIIEESSMDKVDMLSERDQMDMEGQDISNDETNQRVLLDFQVMNDDGETITQVTEILETEEIEPEHLLNEGIGIGVVEVDCQQETLGSIENVYKKIVPDTETTVVEMTEVAEGDMECLPDDAAKKTEPDTEAVSEDELPTEAAAKVFRYRIFQVECNTNRLLSFIFDAQEPETEAVSDEELPAAAPADLGETESVSEDELPLDSEKKKKSGVKATGKTPEKKNKTEGASKFRVQGESS